MLLAIVILFMTVLMGLLFLGIFVWAVKDGQMTDVEEAKYEIFREDEGESA
ncbi:MAG: cbb3-type cytochrome oxidase assembly protein [bacterium]|nr:cbb3-type cytochrome oxidase assembly protein [bacterium]MCP4644746.1 cbb3-type cytochrome oxidase assembly protein [bacterium]